MNKIEVGNRVFLRRSAVRRREEYRLLVILIYSLDFGRVFFVKMKILNIISVMVKMLLKRKMII